MTFFDVSMNENVSIPDNLYSSYDSNFVSDNHDNYTEMQYLHTKSDKERPTGLRLLKLIQKRKDIASVDWDSHFNLESLFSREEYNKDVDTDNFEDRNKYLERKFLLIDF